MTKALKVLDLMEGWHSPYPNITEVFDDYKTMYGIEQVEVECFDYKPHEKHLPKVEKFLETLDGNMGQGDFDGFMQGGEAFDAGAGYGLAEGEKETRALFNDFECHVGMR